MFQSASDLVGRNLSLVVFGSAQTSPNKKADRLLSDLLDFLLSFLNCICDIALPLSYIGDMIQKLQKGEKGR
jgi:hypothetical protein